MPPTARNARTGEFTPPGMKRSAWVKYESDWTDLRADMQANNLQCSTVPGSPDFWQGYARWESNPHIKLGKLAFYH